MPVVGAPVGGVPVVGVPAVPCEASAIVAEPQSSVATRNAVLDNETFMSLLPSMSSSAFSIGRGKQAGGVPHADYYSASTAYDPGMYAHPAFCARMSP